MAELKIDVQDLHKSYGDNEVLKGIDAKFYEGTLYVSSVLQVQVNQPSFVLLTYLNQ